MREIFFFATIAVSVGLFTGVVAFYACSWLLAFMQRDGRDV